jgi:mRNA-degrading endonuclease RelE of RelBE toxin-antitoxin system
MELDPSIEVLDTYNKTFLKLLKKYPHLYEDVGPYLLEFQQGIFHGDKDKNFTYPVYKAKISSQDQKRGKKGGFRLIYLKKDDSFILLMIIYSKSDQEDLIIINSYALSFLILTPWTIRKKNLKRIEKK